jgi:glutathione S-transferase
MALTLIIGNKNYSSWSFRPWIAMKAAGIAFDEIVISLNAPDFKARVAVHSGTGKVPVLIDRDGDARVDVWESLAILEYLAEKFPAARLWPQEPAARAHARAIAAEMHAGFLPLRRACPMNVWRPVKARELPEDARANVRRIDAMWTDCRTRFGDGGPFLFGSFGAADAMYAPVVSRLHTYAVDVGPIARAYMAAVMGLPAWAEWTAAALKEPWVLPEDEVDWPTVLKVPGADGLKRNI